MIVASHVSPAMMILGRRAASITFTLSDLPHHNHWGFT